MPSPIATQPIYLRSEFWIVPVNCSMDMPDGSWEYFCTWKDCTSEQAKQIVESRQVDYRRSDAQMTLYKDYTDEFKSYTSPMFSLGSLLRSKGCDTTKNWAILIKH